MFSDPVVGDHFFGRQSIIDLLVKRANALQFGYRQNVAVIGHQQVGKTSLLRQFLHVLKEPQILVVYVEIKLQALDFFVDQFIRALLFQYLVRENPPLDSAESLAALAAKAAPLIPKTVSRIHDIASLLKHRHAEEAYSKLFELTTVLKQETGKSCIVILDEFHRLGQFGIRNPFSDFGRRIMVQKDTMYLVSSSSFSASRKILAEKLSLLFGNFERIYLENFDFATSFEFLEKKLSPVVLPKNLKYFLVALTDGHPFFLGTIAARIQEGALVKAEQEVSRQTVGEALGKLFYESQGVFNQYFSKVIAPWTQSSARGSHLLILTELAKGRNKLSDLKAAINRSRKETLAQIQELMEQELIVKSGVFYRFHNRVFKFWLREVYEKKELSLLGVGGGTDSFLGRMDAMIKEYEEILAADVSDRFVKLLSLFRNEEVELGEKKRRLPHFTEILKLADEKAAPTGSSRRLIAKGRGRCWICKIVEERVTEREVLELVEGAARDKGASQTRVLVALKGLDGNARLLAKEKKVLTLGLSRVNMLMDIYGASPIIHA